MTALLEHPPAITQERDLAKDKNEPRGRKPKDGGAQKPKPDAHKGTSYPLRFPDARLADVLDMYATRTLRSRNMAIITILMERMQEEGLWPPPDQTE